MASRRSSPSESRGMADESDRATAKSAFFTVLPPEVRTSILVAAFGGRTVHIHQCQPEPWRSQIEGPRYRPPLGAVGTAKRWLGGLTAKAKKPKPGRQRQLCGSICTRPLDQHPAEDDCGGGTLMTCRREALCACRSPPELAIAVGATGWLLTCRKA